MSVAVIGGTGDEGFGLSLRLARAGEDVALQPLLYTGDGLLINVGYRGDPVSPSAQEYLGAAITLATTDGQTLATAHSGFA